MDSQLSDEAPAIAREIAGAIGLRDKWFDEAAIEVEDVTEWAHDVFGSGIVLTSSGHPGRNQGDGESDLLYAMVLPPRARVP
jgi:hypothetical protein